MRKQIGIAALIATAGINAAALAQDSVSSNLGGLIGDALDPWGVNSAAYVVDLAELVTSHGNKFGVAPLLKTTQPDLAFFNNLGSSAGISPDHLMNVPFSSTTYAVWDTAGAGIHATNNTAPSMVTPSGNSSQFAVAYTEFGTSVSANQYTSISGAIVNYDPNDANRLYVDRRTVAITAPSDQTLSSSALGGVSVDANGNVYYRGDNNNVDAGAPNPLTGNNIFRTRMADRSDSVNFIDNAGPLDATDVIVANSADTHVVPNNVPQSVAGGNGLYAGVNFNSEFISGASSGTTTTTAGHLNLDDGRTGSARGSNGGAPVDALGIGAAHTFGIYAKNMDSDTRVMNLFGVDSDGLVIGNKGWEIPASVTDNQDSFVKAYGSFASFENYRFVNAFSGGTGNVAVGSDKDGMGMFAATVAENGFEGDPFNQIVVGRYDAVNDTTEFTFAAYIDVFGIGSIDNNLGKKIFDGEGTEIGQLVDLSMVTNGGTSGPSISAPTIDSAGNVWFISSVELYRYDAKGVPVQSDFDGALIRAVLDPDTFSYTLELVLENGSRMTGPNSGLEYSIGFLGTAFTSNGADHASPSSVWSNSASSASWNNVDISATEPGDTITNGGVFVTTSIIYDINDDGRFNNPTSGNFDPEFDADEAYSVELYVGYYQDEAPCPADLFPDGVLDFFDVSNFLDLFAQGDDYNGDGLTDFFDVSAFLDDFGAGCP